VINAICNALGVKDVPMPATPYTVWKVAQAAAR
jgi:carbon-monoxide dehydrogenase large subunit